MKKSVLVSLLLIIISSLLIGCKSNKDEIKVGTIAGPETALMEVAQQVAKKKYNLDINIKTFSDYVIPNVALNDGSIDANVYQHMPYLEAMVKSRGYELVSIGKTFVYPMGLYSKKLKDISEIPTQATIAIPNDPSNEARALLLLQKAGLIKLSKTFDATVLDITQNPRKIQFKTLTAAQLPRVLSDVDAAIINTNYAIINELSPDKDSIYLEGKDSPYANIIVVRKKDQDNPKLKQLVKALNSPEVAEKAKEIFKKHAIQAW